MQFSTAILALASAMAVSADTLFKVTDFSATCIPHSSQCAYSFNVIQPGTMETTPVKCSKSVTSDGTLPVVLDGTCTNSSRTWTVSKTAEGLILEVTQRVTPSSTQSGSHTIPSAQVVKSQTGASSQEAYTGPAAFDLTE
ncbi:hypothetical protein VP1G_00829 [Cytospora mali]|uniref:Uncharacterized protein n=1 Tax=Cytospora mali TaxID=578113 RepID=A0A194UNW2_CYTMA|nr:hypothetical protein VP1G_00829 [Valsa mali var. pyri (nom. inval.)]